MRLDRTLQLNLLLQIADQYPGPLLQGMGLDFKDPATVRNLIYLEEHGLLTLTKAELNEGGFAVGLARATAKGMDFLEQDGGLTAILGTVTVRLHDDTIKDLLQRTIQESALTPEEKQRWTDQLRELPVETTKHLVLRLVDMGLDQGPQAIAAIGKLLFGA